MCGITGFVNPAREQPAEQLEALLRAMTDAMPHRGPDDEGRNSDPALGLGLGFRRLAIQDLSADGHQPMRSHSGRYEIVYNGEIYNFHELRRSLDQAGAPNWRGHSDTEVLLELIERHGVQQALDMADGMFALALYDREDRTLLLARDRMGEKPLYLGWSGGVFLFGSELKCLMAHDAWQPVLDAQAVSAFVRYGYVPAPHSIFAGVHKLPAGHMVTLSLEDLRAGELPPPVPYWDSVRMAETCAAEGFQGSPDEAVGELEKLLTRSISRRMVADVPLGAFLSGGIDSSAVVALMQRTSSAAVRTYTIGFNHPRFDEAPHAKAVADHLGTDHTELYVETTDPLRMVEKLPEIYDEPFADVSALPTLLLSIMTRNHVTTALSGDGGDELFCGYPRYARTVGQWRSGIPLAAPVRQLMPYMPLGWLNTLSSGARRPGRFGDKLMKKLEDAAAPSLERLYESHYSRWRTVDKPVADPVIGYYRGGGVRPQLEDDHMRLMYADAVSYLPDDLLVKVDRASMAVSLEVRAPMLSREVVEFAWRLPTNLKRRDGMGKWALRQMLYRHVPQQLIDRPKMGFEPPLADWLRGPLRDWAQGLISSSRLEQDGLLDPEPIRAIWEEHLKGQRNWHFELWNILMLQSWRSRWSV